MPAAAGVAQAEEEAMIREVHENTQYVTGNDTHSLLCKDSPKKQQLGIEAWKGRVE